MCQLLDRGHTAQKASF